MELSEPDVKIVVGDAVVEFLKSNFTNVRYLDFSDDVFGISFQCYSNYDVRFVINVHLSHLYLHAVRPSTNAGSFISQYEYSHPKFPQNLYQRLLKLPSQSWEEIVRASGLCLVS